MTMTRKSRWTIDWREGVGEHPHPALGTAPTSITGPVEVMPVSEHQDTLAKLGSYVNNIAELRRRASDKNRDAYTAALGQLHAVGLIDEPTWREALDRPRVK